MAQNVSLWGASYSNVPTVRLPKTGGGTASFNDTTGATATADKIMTGYTAWVNGMLLTGTASGGAQEIETGTYKPTADTSRPTISFSRTHTKMPAVVCIIDTAASTTTNTYLMWCYVDIWQILRYGWAYGSTISRYGFNLCIYRGTSTSSVSSTVQQFEYASNSSGDSSTKYPRYFVTESQFRPATSSTSRYWRSGRTYTWWAYWLP
jgi:hypothetical protein